MELGDIVHKALTSIGITEDRVQRWLGECRCLERREKLNWLGAWSRQTLAGKLANAGEWLEKNLKVN